MIAFECPHCRHSLDLAPFLEGGKAKCAHCQNVPTILWEGERGARRPTAAKRDGDRILIPPGSTAPLDECLDCGAHERVVVREAVLSWVPAWALLPGMINPGLAPAAGAMFTGSAAVLIPECDCCVSARRRRKFLVGAGAFFGFFVIIALFGVLGEVARQFIPTSSRWHDDAFYVGLVVGFVAWCTFWIGMRVWHGKKSYSCLRIDKKGVLLGLPSRLPH
ncbi:MAG: hypothetical protein FD180_1092 [Planctomycetota bacterium]|nr:MAG: hypothetical protein FD180_1092 [Planctomycetota bacterium]